MSRIVRSVLGHLGYEKKSVLYPDPCSGLTDAERAEYEAVRGRTMVQAPNVVQACNAARHAVAADVPGAVVECGVWRGGVMMAMLRALLAAGHASREAWLYDTYEGLPPPGPEDAERVGGGDGPLALFARDHRPEGSGSTWCRASLEDVREGVLSVGYPERLLRFVKGKVEDTVPAQAPERIAVLRLDTDWYESTRHELIHLWPRLSAGGVLIIDDYGTWAGARKAADEFFASLRRRPFVARGPAGVGYVVKPHD